MTVSPGFCLGYSWVVHQLHIGRTPAFLLPMSNFKSVTSFGTLTETTWGMILWIFCKSSKQAHLVSFRVLSFLLVFFVVVAVLVVELKIHFF